MKNLHLAGSRVALRLDQELGRGGEGTVYGLVGSQDIVAKIYLAPVGDKKVQKLVIMAETSSPALLKIAAWPTDIVVDDMGRACGFIMPRITARRDLHELYSPKSRSAVFPDADFRFLIHVGANAARAFAVVHEHGHILGDVNHGNILVGPNGTVMLIDCDSFQVNNGLDVFTCDVGVPLFTASELHGRPFRGLRRDKNHDAFGLAVVLFLLLFMGRHPFAGRYLGAGDMPIERAIAEYRFAYGTDRFLRHMDSPPGALPLESVGDTVRDLFFRAFVKNGSNILRPAASEWVRVLEDLKNSLRECQIASWHHFPKQLGSCPWCKIEQESGARLFGYRAIRVAPLGIVDISGLWAAIEGVSSPGPAPPLPSEKPWSLPPGVEMPSPTVKNLRRAVSAGLVLTGVVSCSAVAADGGVIGAFVLYGLAFAVWPWVGAERIAAADKAVSASKEEWESVLRLWHSQAASERFDLQFSALRKAKSQLQNLPRERRRRLAKIEERRQLEQKHRYLDRFRIDRSSIPGIGPTRASMLASYGIETAADVTRKSILSIPGFGYALTSLLTEWREAHERNFRFNPSEPTDPRELAKMEQELKVLQEAELAKLRQGSAELRRISEKISAERLRLMPLLDEAWTKLKIAEAQRSAL
jgi:DNA-binding helix-hairpin-helix protein with protein kinase domain